MIIQKSKIFYGVMLDKDFMSCLVYTSLNEAKKKIKENPSYWIVQCKIIKSYPVKKGSNYVQTK